MTTPLPRVERDLTYRELQQVEIYRLLAFYTRRGQGVGRSVIAARLRLAPKGTSLRDLLDEMLVAGWISVRRQVSEPGAPLWYYARCCAGCRNGEWHEWHEPVK